MDRRDDFLRLFLRHQAEVRAFIGSLVRDPHLREDIFQEVALILWRQYDEYDPARSFGAWARGIASNKIMQQWDKAARMPVALAPEAVRAMLDAFERTETEAPAEADALERCMGQLPEKSRKLLTLRYEQGFKLDEVARQVQSTLHAVHMALSRIRSRLAECMKKRAMQTEGAW